MIAFGLMLATTEVCQTATTDCDMGHVASGIDGMDVCILACGVLLPADLVKAPDFLSNISSLPLSGPSTAIGFLPEPAFRPPRDMV